MPSREKPSPDDICPRPDPPPPQTTKPLAPAIYTATVWSCDSTQQAERMLTGEEAGYVYQRDGHPNGDYLANKLKALHGADEAIVTSSGMAALAASVLAVTEADSKIVASSRLYGKSLVLLQQEATRFGVRCEIADSCDLEALEAACDANTRLVVVETISNPNLRVANLPKIAEIAHARDAVLLVDNTFATPIHCRPLDWGADLVVESVSKMINGHSDVMLGAVCGKARFWPRIFEVVSAWGMCAAPFDCYLATRGLATLHLRMQRASETARSVAEWLATQPEIRAVDYPGLAAHQDHALAAKLLDAGFGSMVALHLRGGREAADAFLQAASHRLPFAPSLGEVCTTLSHPASTSHRGVDEDTRNRLGFDAGTVRVSIGVESEACIREALDLALHREKTE